MNSPELEVIPVVVRLKYLLLKAPSTLRYFTRCLISLLKGKPIYKRVKIGDKFTSFDGREFEYIKD
jgi:hypothetical protein